jgi:RNA polymerase sigma-70 factor (ECF subfamily)
MKFNFKEIYKQHSKYVFNVALSVMKNTKDAEDIMQDVFIKFFENMDNFRGEADIKTYLYKMTVNKSIDYIRKQAGRREKLVKIFETNIKSETQILVLNDLLDKLTMNEKLPLILSEIGGFSYKEIAEILNIKIGTVKSRINRSINKLKNILKKEKTDEMQ